MIVLDASVLIAHLDAADAHHERAGALLLDIADEPLGASPLSLAEVLVGPARAGQLDRATAVLRQLHVTGVRLGEDAPTRLAVLRVGTGLRLPDCCVLLAAEQTHGAVATFDARLAAAARERGFVVRDPEPSRNKSAPLSTLLDERQLLVGELSSIERRLSDVRGDLEDVMFGAGVHRNPDDVDNDLRRLQEAEHRARTRLERVRDEIERARREPE